MEKTIVYLPIVAAIMWGATYVLTERIFQHVTVSTWLVVGGSASILVAFLLPLIGLPGMDFKPLLRPDVIGIALLALLVAQIANVSILASIKYINATYAAVIEICYVIFVPIFSYLIYGYRNFNMTTLVGGLIIFIGVLVVIRGQYLTQGAASHASI